MGCFLHCFRSSKGTKHRRNAPHHHHHRNDSAKPEQLTLSSPQETLLTTDSPLQVKPQQLNASPKKKVTFDSNVKTYEPVLVADFQEEGEDLVERPSKLYSEEDGSVTSTGSYPTNHRYHNCSHSDDEDGEMDDWDSDLTDEEGGGDSDMEEEYDDEVGEDSEDSAANLVPIPVCDEAVKPIWAKNPNARDRSVYVHPVLNPVQDLTQWKAVKAKKAPTLMSQKENIILNQQESPKKLNKEIAVDASLSNWLVSPESAISKDLYERSSPQGSSSSVISHEDRPILGALTVQEIKQFSTCSSPRKSPIRGVNERPIIGSVGSYWNSGG